MRRQASDRGFTRFAPSGKTYKVDRNNRPILTTRLAYIRADSVCVSTVCERLQELLDEEYCADLIESIRDIGHQVPVAVLHSPKKGSKYELISGSRRLWVIKYLTARGESNGWIKAEILPGFIPLPEKDFDGYFYWVQISRACNIFRRSSAYEVAKRTEYAFQASGLSQVEFAKELNISKSTLSARLQFSRLPTDAAKALGLHLSSLKPPMASKWLRIYHDRSKDLVTDIARATETAEEKGLSDLALIRHVNSALKLRLDQE